jgi:hypothetical protein
MTAALPAACGLAFGILPILVAGDSYADAWLMAPGQGQVIAGSAFSGSTRAFDGHGKLIPVAPYEKFELGAYIEYGVADWLTLVADPALDHIRQPAPAASYDGAGESGAGLRVPLYRADPLVASLRAILLSPGASFNSGVQPRRSGSIDLRAMAGANFTLGAWPAFADSAAGYRFYAQAQPGEWRLDLTLGVRPDPDLLLLLQSFGAIQTSRSAAFPRSSWEKLQASLVYDFAPSWSAQIGGFMTVAGVNTGRECGPMAALWHRF